MVAGLAKRIGRVWNNFILGSSTGATFSITPNDCGKVHVST